MKRRRKRKQQSRDPRCVRFGEQVWKYRKKMGWSQENLAELSNLHRTYIGGIERGERNVSLLNITAIAKALKIPVAVLFPKQ